MTSRSSFWSRLRAIVDRLLGRNAPPSAPPSASPTPVAVPSPAPPPSASPTPVAVPSPAPPPSDWFDISGTPEVDEFGLWRPKWLAQAVGEVEARGPYGPGVEPLPLALHVAEAAPYAPSDSARELIRLNLSQFSTGFSTSIGHFRGPCSTFDHVPVNPEYPHLGTRPVPSKKLPRSAAVLVDTTTYRSRYSSESALRAGFRSYFGLA